MFHGPTLPRPSALSRNPQLCPRGALQADRPGWDFLPRGLSLCWLQLGLSERERGFVLEQTGASLHPHLFRTSTLPIGKLSQEQIGGVDWTAVLLEKDCMHSFTHALTHSFIPTSFNKGLSEIHSAKDIISSLGVLGLVEHGKDFKELIFGSAD